MNRSAAKQTTSSSFELLQTARAVLRCEAAAIERFSEQIPVEFSEAIRLFSSCTGSVLVTGIGKAGWIGQKISASLASLGTRSHFLHPSEAFHGDFGRIGHDDAVLILSNSGETEEVLRLLPTISKFEVPKVAITAVDNSTLARECDVAITYGRVTEACSLGLAPSTTTSLMLAIGDAIALTLAKQNGFSELDFAGFHPGGSLGRKLQPVREAMKSVIECRVCLQSTPVRKAVAEQAKGKRRSGAILVTDESGLLTGIFTDSDLVRLLEHKQDHLLDQPIREVMTSDPKKIGPDELVPAAVQILSENRISELPVVDEEGRAIGMIDITDVI